MKRQYYNNLQNFLAIAADNWLRGNFKQEYFNQIAQDQFNQFNQFFHAHQYRPQILLIESDPVQFLASFIAAVAAHCPIFLSNPHWQELEWQQVFQQIKPDIILGEITFHPPQTEKGNHHNLDNCIMIPTGGTSGQIKFAVHTWNTLTASVEGFQQYFKRLQIHSYCILPLYHVSGLMQFIRSFITGGQLVIQPFKAVNSGNFIKINPANFYISLVPTQLQRLLQSPQTTQWLSQFHTVLLGGAPAWPELLEQARADQIRLAPTYGMTETASQIATLKPEYFLAGYQNSGQILPHAQIKIFNDKGEILTNNNIGLVQIKADSLMLGYYSQFFYPETRIKLLKTDDLGYLDKQQYLTIIGRNSEKIITGGENVFPAEIEAVIRATGLVKEVCVIGLPNTEWGEIVTVVYTPLISQNKLDYLKQNLIEKLSKYKHPKLWISVDEIPRNSQGKINRQSLKKWAESLNMD
ncbi:MAG: 2-succinylbenzoate--CoA ligase [Microcoleaceae cyanobacterium]